MEAADLTSTTTGLDLDSMLDRSDSDLSTADARTIRKQLEGLENMYSEVSAMLLKKNSLFPKKCASSFPREKFLSFETRKDRHFYD